MNREFASAGLLEQMAGPSREAEGTSKKAKETKGTTSRQDEAAKAVAPKVTPPKKKRSGKSHVHDFESRDSDLKNWRNVGVKIPPELDDVIAEKMKNEPPGHRSYAVVLRNAAIAHLLEGYEF